MAVCENLMGTICKDSKAYHQALKNYEKALELSKELNDMYMYAGILNNIGIVQELLGNYEKSKKNAVESLELADSLDFSNIAVVSNKLLYHISLLTGDTINSVLHFQQVVRHNDRLYNTKDFQKIVGTIAKHQNEEYEQNILIYDKLLTRKDFWIWVLMHVNTNSLNVSLHRLKKKLQLEPGVSVDKFLQSDIFNPRSTSKTRTQSSAKEDR